MNAPTTRVGGMRVGAPRKVQCWIDGSGGAVVVVVVVVDTLIVEVKWWMCGGNG